VNACGTTKKLLLRYAEAAQERALFAIEQIVIILLNMLAAGRNYCQLFKRNKLKQY
jgi:hypothetical protein